MIFAILVITLVFHLVVPLTTMFWMVRSKANSKIQWISIVSLTISYALMMWAGGAGWHMFGYYLADLFLILSILVFILSLKKRWSLPWLSTTWKKTWAGNVVRFFLAGFFLWSFFEILGARNYPKDKAVELAFPIVGGNFYIVHGGSSEGVNHHYPFIAQRYALDIVQLNSLGMRAQGLAPTELAKYFIYGAELVAPCSGQVIAAGDGLPDQTPPNMDAEKPFGNHVVIYCQDLDVSVALAHMAKDSVLVKAGESVEQGTQIGKVGNSGNTSEPHLHIHAVSGEHSDLETLGYKEEGVPIAFKGKFLVRGDRF